MTRTEAAVEFANAYRAYQVAKERTFNIEVATAYATQDILNQTKHLNEGDAVFQICDEAAFLREAV